MPTAFGEKATVIVVSSGGHVHLGVSPVNARTTSTFPLTPAMARQVAQYLVESADFYDPPAQQNWRGTGCCSAEYPCAVHSIPP